MEHTLTAGSVIGDRPRPAKNYLNETKGIWSWMTTVDHKRIGIMYLVARLLRVPDGRHLRAAGPPGCC